MAKKIRLSTKDEQSVFIGKVIDLPIKKESIKQMSITLFNDPEPCVIHESYSVSKLTEGLSEQQKKLKTRVKLTSLELDLSYLELVNLDDLYIEVVKWSQSTSIMEQQPHS